MFVCVVLLLCCVCYFRKVDLLKALAMTNTSDIYSSYEEKVDRALLLRDGDGIAEVSDQIDGDVCASCGMAPALDNVQLKGCACNSVKYCSDKCQKLHGPKHEKECKKRVAEIRKKRLAELLRDKDLFTQPESSHLGDCPICCLPMPLDSGSKINSCCSKRICDGCHVALAVNSMEEKLRQKCAYCREPMPGSQEEIYRRIMKRVKANDPVAMLLMGEKCVHDEGDYDGAFQYFSKAAALGNIEAHYHLALMYTNGQGVDKDDKKKLYHLEEAAIGGHHGARWYLGDRELKNGTIDRAMNHFIIAAKLGSDTALNIVKAGFGGGFGPVSKEDYASTLRGHQAAVDATKSPRREGAKWLLSKKAAEKEGAPL